MKQVGVQKHRREKCAKISPAKYRTGNQTVAVNGRFQSAIRIAKQVWKPVSKENDCVNYYENPCDVRGCQRLGFIPNRNQIISPNVVDYLAFSKPALR